MKSLPNALIININKKQKTLLKKYFILSTMKKYAAASMTDSKFCIEIPFIIGIRVVLKKYYEIHNKMYLWEEKKQYLLVAINREKSFRVDLVFWKNIIFRKEIMVHRGKKSSHLKDSWKSPKPRCILCKVNFHQKLIVLLNFKRMQET